MRRFARIALLLLGIPLATLLIGALVPRPLLPAVGPLSQPRHILVLHNPIHTDIAIPIDREVAERFSFMTQAGLPLDIPGAVYAVFGWGGRDFYLNTPSWSELKASAVFSALTVDRAVMHVSVIGDVPEDHPAVRRLALGEAEYSTLLDFIDASFTRDGSAVLPIDGAAYGEYDRFFEAQGRFNALLGCNTWTAAALRAAGQRTGWWNPLPLSLDASLSLYNDLPASQPGGVQP
ncbi:TIGR02117 family protein [Oryzicola mucosus]|uniref:TIGR02117 family protein n=1 Tax=Oryzicola mucosus TaxID=2767425 RepID=A0A8J6PX26_9HYPH|nr:TIGR02117 family protein [Oryzicola mucosus]MBD0415742.1 TIGR02117 family protein [Oryzicola mucosus]